MARITSVDKIIEILKLYLKGMKYIGYISDENKIRKIPLFTNGKEVFAFELDPGAKDLSLKIFRVENKEILLANKQPELFDYKKKKN